MSTDVAAKVEQVNALLLAGEPGNITKPDTNGYVGYEPQAIIDAMNEGFGIGEWGFEEVSSETVDNEKGTLAVARIAVWLAGIDFKPASWGQSRVTRGDIGDARKGAQTDAIKKALAYFSIGNRAYHGLLEKDKKPAPQPTRPAAKPAQPTIDRDEALRELARPGPARAGKGQPEPESIDNADETVRRMIIIARSRCQKAGLDWEEVKTGVFGVPTPDKDLISKAFMHINKRITEEEQSRKTA